MRVLNVEHWVVKLALIKLNYSILILAGDTFQNTGAITTAKTLDRENIGQYHLTIVATDGSTLRGGPTHSATTVAVIRILDENDNEPKCEQDRHNFSVDEDVAVDVAVGPAVKAVDGDEGANGKVAYTLTAGNVGSR